MASRKPGKTEYSNLIICTLNMNSLNTKKWNSEDWIKNYMPYTKISLSRKIQMGEKPNDIKQKIVGDIKTK